MTSPYPTGHRRTDEQRTAAELRERIANAAGPARAGLRIRLRFELVDRLAEAEDWTNRTAELRALYGDLCDVEGRHAEATRDLARDLAVELGAHAVTTIDLEHAVLLRRERLDRFDAIGTAVEQAQERLELGVLLRRLGRFGAAVILFDDAAHVAQSAGEVALAHACRAHAGAALLAAGDTNRAAQDLRALDKELAAEMNPDQGLRRFIARALQQCGSAR